MSRRLSSALVLCIVALLTTSSVLAQSIRPQRTFYFQPRVGITNYVGDYDTTPFDFDDWSADSGFPVAFGGELGYQISTRFSVSAAYMVGDYPTIIPLTDDGEVPANALNDYTWRHTANLFLKWTVQGSELRVAPFFQAGLHGTVGFTDFTEDPPEDLIGIGPAGGLGLDIALSDRASLITEFITNLVVPDEAADGAGEEVDERGRFDLLSFLGIGLKWNFKSAFTPVDVVDIDCPSNLLVNESGTFTATVDEAASAPVEYRWDFGDGTTGMGLIATHSYDRAGTFDVRFTASNEGSSDSEECEVMVAPLPVAAEIISVTGAPMSFQVCEPVTVQFNADVLGDDPLTYQWEFGDGTTATGPTASHTYTEPGNYNVTLTLTNPEGTVTRSITVQALDCEADICDEVTDLNSVYFDRNSSTLSEEARAALRENLEILLECPNICVRIVGYAAPGERSPQQLSEDRARAVEQFYIDNGVAASRLMVVGEGRVPGTTKKEAGAQHRRVDSIPGPCM